MTNLEKIRKISEQQVIELLLAATRDDLSYFDICSCNCDTCVIQELCISPKDDVISMGESEWKEWLEMEADE